jgi:hypothetical protein
MASYWQWMTEHWFWGSILSFVVVMTFMTTVGKVFTSFFRIFHKQSPPKIVIKIEGREVEAEEENANIVHQALEAVTRQLEPENTRWDRISNEE